MTFNFFFFLTVWRFHLESHIFPVVLRRNDCIVNMLLFLAAEAIKLISELKKNKIFKPTLPGECYIAGVDVI